MLVNVVLNWFLIPGYSYFGASVATIVSLAVSLVLHIHFLYRTDYRPALPRALLGPVAALGIAWSATVLVAALVFPSWRLGWLGMSPAVGWGPFIAVFLTVALLYPAALAGLRILKMDDVRLLKDLFGPPRG
jgi:O-antigen/teichoic acid export membrane protein